MGVRQGLWKLITASVQPGNNKKKGAALPFELYNLAEDIGEAKNLAGQYPDKVKELRAIFTRVQQNGRSR